MSTVTLGAIRRDWNSRRCSRALYATGAMSSLIDFASFPARRSFVGVAIRSTSTTSSPSATSSLSAARTSDDLP